MSDGLSTVVELRFDDGVEHDDVTDALKENFDLQFIGSGHDTLADVERETYKVKA